LPHRCCQPAHAVTYKRRGDGLARTRAFQRAATRLGILHLSSLTLGPATLPPSLPSYHTPRLRCLFGRRGSCDFIQLSGATIHRPNATRTGRRHAVRLSQASGRSHSLHWSIFSVRYRIYRSAVLRCDATRVPASGSGVRRKRDPRSRACEKEPTGTRDVPRSVPSLRHQYSNILSMCRESPTTLIN
jgi:hypothetical protein